MLISFSVSNFRSIGEEVTLNMVASNKLTAHETHRVAIGDTGNHVLRAAVIYGANAAGKSNLVRAIGTAQQIILGNRQLSLMPFRFNPEMAGKPTSFEFRFLIGNQVFVYGFDVLGGHFDYEWLSLSKGSGDDVLLFERDVKGNATVNGNAKRHFPDNDITFETLGKLKSLQLRADQLFLNRAMELPEFVQGKALGSVIRWLTSGLVILDTDYRTCNLLDRLETDQTFKEFCGRFLNSVGTGVGALDVRQSERAGQDYECKLLANYPSPYNPFGCDGVSDIRLKPDNPARVIIRQLLAWHEGKGGRYDLPFTEESLGTKSLLHLLSAIASLPNESRVVVIDELDRSLHPLICAEYIRFFSESCPGARRQLIVTTHEAHLLDQELLRRDEYWFVQKDEWQQSQLVSLSEFNVRNDLQIQKGYLNGRFGAIPIIGGMQSVERLLQCNGGEESENAAKTPPA